MHQPNDERTVNMRTFYRTLIQVEVLSEQRYDPYKELDEVADDITDGDCNGNVTVLSANQELTGPETAQRLLDSGSDPGFFRLTDAGDDTDEEI